MRKAFFFTTLAGVIAIFSSCTKTETTTTKGYQTKSTGGTTIDKFTSQQIESIGVKHNQYLNEFLTSCLNNPACSDIETFKTYFYNYQFQNFDDPNRTDQGLFRANIAGKVLNGNIDNNQAIESYKTVLKNIADNSSNYKALSNAINNEMQNVEQNTALSNVEYNSIMAMFSVAKHSAYYWMSTAEGGSGQGFTLANTLHAQYPIIFSPVDDDFPARTRWENDALGAAWGGVCWSAATAWTGVGTVGGFIYGCVSGAIGSSCLICNPLWKNIIPS